MTDSNLNSRVNAKRAIHQDAILENDASNDRYRILKKNKTSQAHNSVSNSCSFVDTGNDVKFNVSVTVTCSRGEDKSELAPEKLKELQSLVTKFMTDIHTKI